LLENGEEIRKKAGQRLLLTGSGALIEENKMESDVPDTTNSRSCLVCHSRFWLGSFLTLVMIAAAGFGYWFGNQSSQRQMVLPPEILHATATHGGSNLAVATGQIDDDSEGIFFLDYLTGDLQCWVFYPRTGAFGAKFATNVSAQLPGGKNAEYLLVTGGIVAKQAGANARMANSLAYVVDVRSGVFAAYGLPWNKSSENSGQPQMGQLVSVGGGQFRNPAAGAPPPVAPGNAANPPNPGKK
jgi:hypothetical protein